MNVDHIKPIGRGLDWNEFINRLFCETSNLQAICVPCHKIKSKAEK